MNCRKSQVIHDAILKGSGPAGLLFVDDDMHNIQDVVDNVGCDCVHVDNTGRRMKGMVEYDCNTVRTAVWG